MQPVLDQGVYNPQRNRQNDLAPESEQHQKDANPKARMRQFSVHRNRLRIVSKAASANVALLLKLAL